MFIAYAVVAVLLALGLVMSGRAKLVKDEKVTAGLTANGVPLSWFPRLAAAEIAGAVGLLAGLAFRPFGIAAAIGVVLYFIGAVLTHVRTGDLKGAPPAAVLLVTGVAALVLGIISA